MARKIGSFQYLFVHRDGKLKGYNTDGIGFFRGYTPPAFSIKGKTMVLLGAGGCSFSDYCTEDSPRV